MNVLFLTHRLPYAPNRCDRIRAFHLLQQMATFADVSVFSLVHDDEEAGQVDQLTSAREVRVARVSKPRNLMLAAARWFSKTPITHSLLDAGGAHATLSEMV